MMIIGDCVLLMSEIPLQQALGPRVEQYSTLSLELSDTKVYEPDM
jgi:hypothetical protein